MLLNTAVQSHSQDLSPCQYNWVSNTQVEVSFAVPAAWNNLNELKLKELILISTDDFNIC